MIEDIARGEIDTSILYLSMRDMVKELCVSKQVVLNAAKRDDIHLIRYGRGLIATPEEVARLKALIEAGGVDARVADPVAAYNKMNKESRDRNRVRHQKRMEDKNQSAARWSPG